MKICSGRKWLAFLAAVCFLVLCSVSAFAAGSVPVKPAQSLSGYTLQKTETASDTVTLRYQNAAGAQMSVVYTSTGQAAQQLGVRQYSSAPVLYACYSDDFDLNNIGTVYYTVGECTVTVRSLNSSGSAVKVDKTSMLAFLEEVQSSPMPVSTGVCAVCGGAVYTSGAQVGSWKEGSGLPCSHGGTLKYSDISRQRSVCVTSVCADCGKKTQDSYTQSALYCSYSNSWLGISR